MKAASNQLNFVLHATVSIVVVVAQTCSSNVASVTTVTAKSSCMQWSAGTVYDYPSGFTIKSKYASWRCPTSGKRIIISNGIPNHRCTQGNPNSPCEMPWRVDFPLNPTVSGTLTEPQHLGPVAIAKNGVIIYGAQEAGGTNAVEPTGQIQDAQYSWGHAARSGDWHYHNPHLGYTTTPSETTLLGYALDGFPIYGPLADTSGLDECNGRTVDGSYRYHVKNKNQVDGNANYCNGNSAAVKWDYIIGCYKGAISSPITDASTNRAIPSDCVMESSENCNDLVNTFSLTGVTCLAIPSGVASDSCQLFPLIFNVVAGAMGLAIAWI